MNSTATTFSDKELKKAFFRCDASAECGSGHVMRCMTLAEELVQKGWECSFLTAETTHHAVPVLKNRQMFKILPADYKPDNADLLIVDHYDLDHEYESVCRDWVKKIMVIDDLVNRRHDCDLLLDQTFGREPEAYRSLVPSEAKVICGKQYMLLRPQFTSLRRQAEDKRKKIKRVENIFINFGSINPSRLTQRILSVLSAFKEWSLNIDVVMGAAAEDLADIESVIQEISVKTDHHVKLQVGVEDMASIMLQSDLAFGAGGTTSWERACLGLPAIMTVISPDQEQVCEVFEKAGAAYYLGVLPSITEAQIDNAFKKVRDNKDLLEKMSKSCFDICDGLGGGRVEAEISELIMKDSNENN